MSGALIDGIEMRVLALVPTARDAELTRSLLARVDVECVCCSDHLQLCERLAEGAGAILVAEEAVHGRNERLVRWLDEQPPWSDLPVLVLARPGTDSAAVAQAMDLLGNVTVLERPLRISALVSIVRTALRGRRRQYETRAHLAEIERAQRALETSERRFRDIFNTAGVALWEEDFTPVETALERLRNQGVRDLGRYFEEHPEFVREAMAAVRVLDVNDSTVAMFEARDKHELRGSLPGIFVPESMPVFVEALKAVADRHRSFEAEALLSTVRGNPLHVCFTMVLAGAGQPNHRVLFSAVDITERKRTETVLREADRRKDEFLAILAHELRNPLAPIRNSLHILRLTAGQDPAAERLAEMMERQVNHMVRLVDDLLEVSRISLGKIDLRKETVEVASIVSRAIEASGPAIEAAGHRLTVELPPDELILEGDSVRLAQVLSNLLSNAAKYTEPGGHIRIAVRGDGRWVKISVRDDGNGIASELLPHVFELFTQAKSYEGRARGGLGIGLALVKSLVEMHGGSVGASSEGPGLGSEFVVRLPLADQRVTTASSSESDRCVPIAARRVMVVDDNRDAAESLGMLLTMLGADVHVVYSGQEALDALATHNPSVVLLDIGMPDMDGLEVARRIRQRKEFEDLTLIALTGWGHEEDRQRSRTAGFDYHLIKPADLHALQSLLGSL